MKELNENITLSLSNRTVRKCISKLLKEYYNSIIPKNVIKAHKCYPTIIKSQKIWRITFSNFIEEGKHFTYYMEDQFEIPCTGYGDIGHIDKNNIKNSILKEKLDTCIKILSEENDKILHLKDILNLGIDKFLKHCPIPYVNNWKESEKEKSREEIAKELLTELKTKVDSALKRR